MAKINREVTADISVDISMDQLRKFSTASASMVTVDAPLFGVVMILNGQIIPRGPHEADKVGTSIGFPPREEILAEATRFWIQDEIGVRRRKTRDEMCQLLREFKRAAGSS
jgi:hypothetical protein